MSKKSWEKLLLIDSVAYLITILSFFLLFIKAIDYRIVVGLAVLTIILFILLIKAESSVPFYEELMFDDEDDELMNGIDKEHNGSNNKESNHE